jgi:hypothetical protein
MRNFPLTVLKILLILFQNFPGTLATIASFTNTKSEHFNRESTRLKVNHFNFNYKLVSFFPFPLTLTMAENQYTPIQQTEAEITFHDTIQRRQPHSPSTSVTSQSN